VVSNKK